MKRSRRSKPLQPGRLRVLPTVLKANREKNNRGAPMQGLNEAHVNRILITLLDLRRQLERVEDAILQPAKLAPFFEHDNDLSADQIQAILKCFASLRTALLQAAEKLELPVEVRRTSLSWELQCLLTHFQISLVEIGPKQMRGYGEVGKPASGVLQQVQQELGKLVSELATQVTSLSQENGAPGNLEAE